MQVYREHQPGGNFGDDMNDWLWPRVFPGMFDEPGGGYLAGIGTILDGTGCLPTDDRLVVFGTGVRYRNPVPKMAPNWDVRFVRGPMSREALGLDEHQSITDAATCIRLIDYDYRRPKKYPCSYVPHYRSIDHPFGLQGWRMICRLAGLHLIDPRAGVEHTLEEIASSERVIAEAMHGAILADTFRVPWRRVRTSYDEHHQPVDADFKWFDWAMSIDVVPAPIVLPAIRPSKRLWGVVDRLWDPARIPFIIHALRKARTADCFELSSDATIERLDARLHDEVETLRRAHGPALAS